MEEIIDRLKKYKTTPSNVADELSSSKYFDDLFSHLTVHEQLMNDYETVAVFQDWINNNKDLIKVTLPTVSIVL